MSHFLILTEGVTGLMSERTVETLNVFTGQLGVIPKGLREWGTKGVVTCSTPP